MHLVMANYDHDPADLSFVYLAVVDSREPPAETDWQPAYRDTLDVGEPNERKVVWIRSDAKKGVIWLRDATGERRIGQVVSR